MKKRKPATIINEPRKRIATVPTAEPADTTTKTQVNVVSNLLMLRPVCYPVDVVSPLSCVPIKRQLFVCAREPGEQKKKFQKG
jgi:hypothetical protein